MRCWIAALLLCTAVSSPARAALADGAGPAERPADALDSLLLTDGEVLRGVVLSSSADAVALRLSWARSGSCRGRRSAC